MPISKIKTSSILADAASTNLNIDAGTLFLDATNNRVGVGLSSPQTKLDINGVIRLTPNSADTGYTADIMANYNSEHPFQINVKNNNSTAEYFGIYASAGGSDNRVVFPTGNVGIGTSSPGEKLHVSGNIRMSSVAGTNTNAALPVLFQTSTGTIEGGSGLTYNPGSDLLSVNGMSITASTVSGAGDSATFTCANAAGQYDYKVHTDSLRFIAGSSERMRIDSSGNVGIGTASPGSAVGGKCLTIYNTSHATLSIQAVDGGNDRSATLELLSSGNGASYSQILYGDTDTTPGTPSPLVFAGYHSGTRTERMRIDSSGNVGIGTSSPLNFSGTNLQVQNSNVGSIVWSNGTYIGQLLASASAEVTIGSRSNHPLRFCTNDTERMRIDTGGNCFLGATSAVDSSRMQITGAKTFSSGIPLGQLNVADSTAYAAGVGGAIAFGGKYHSAGFYTTYASIEGVKENATDNHYSGNLVFRIRSNGGDNVERMRIGALDNTIRLYSGTGGSSPALVFGEETSAAKKAIFLESFWLVIQGHNNEGIRFQTTNGSGTITTRMTINGNGSVSIPGSLSKGSGSFRIEHPLPEKSETHELVHSFIEGPQADLIYRGKVNLVAGAATVNIDTVSGMTEGTFEVLCRDVQCFTTNESDWTAVRGSVTGNILTIEAQDNTSTASISWMVIGERKDKHMYDTGWTDDDGKVIVEPLKVQPEEIAPVETE